MRCTWFASTPHLTTKERREEIKWKVRWLLRCVFWSLRIRVRWERRPLSSEPTHYGTFITASRLWSKHHGRIYALFVRVDAQIMKWPRYGLVLVKMQQKPKARQQLIQSVLKYPCNWSAWLELASCFSHESVSGGGGESHTRQEFHILSSIPESIIKDLFCIHLSSEVMSRFLVSFTYKRQKDPNLCHLPLHGIAWRQNASKHLLFCNWKPIITTISGNLTFLKSCLIDRMCKIRIRWTRWTDIPMFCMWMRKGENWACWRGRAVAWTNIGVKPVVWLVCDGWWISFSAQVGGVSAHINHFVRN